MTTMNNKTCIVTGGNTGIGKETVRGLAKAGATVILACRDTRKGEEARADVVASTGDQRVHVMELDLARMASIRAFAAAFRAAHGRLDVLVNNAGVATRTRQTTADGLELTFGVNHLGHFLLTQELLDLLKASAPARVVNVASAVHRRAHLAWDDLQYTRRKYSAIAAYNESKLANVLFTAALAERLAGTGVTANSLHPGVVATEIMRELPSLLVKVLHLFLVTPAAGAETSLYLATSPDVATVSGKYFEKCAAVRPSVDALDRAAQERLWDVSEELVRRHAQAAA